MWCLGASSGAILRDRLERTAMTLEQEQAAFDAQLPELLKEHRGEFVLFKEGRPAGFFKDHGSAYAAGLQRFGLGVAFSVVAVSLKKKKPISFDWETGVMFGKRGE